MNVYVGGIKKQTTLEIETIGKLPFWRHKACCVLTQAMF